MVMISGDANRLRTSEVRHTVDYADVSRNLGRLQPEATCPKDVGP